MTDPKPRNAEPKPKRSYKLTKPQPEPPKPKAGFDTLVELHRDRVLELESRGYLPNQIAAVIRAPYKVVEHVLTTKAKPRRRTP